MDSMLLRVFQHQILLQCDFLLRATNDINSALNNGDIDGAFYGIQNLLTAAANISKALWGQGGKLSAERRELRDSLGIDDGSPLREVTMRNHFEHFDERLDRWWKESKAHNHNDRNLFPRAAITNFEDLDNFRNFDPGTTDLTFWGQDFNLQQLIKRSTSDCPKAQRRSK